MRKWGEIFGRITLQSRLKPMQYQFALDTCIENGFNSNYRGPEIAKKFQDSPTKTKFCICVITLVFVVLWQVSLLEYRNRSRNRLSVDTPRTLPSQSAGVTSVTNGSSSSSLSHLVMKSPSLPNLSSPSTTPSFVHRQISSSGEMNGPHVEPVSPDMEEKSTGRDDCIDEKALFFLPSL